MDVFIYQADIYCHWCGSDRCRELNREGVGDDGDSDTYPQGPYGNGGGEADSPQHCGDCGLFLENPLTPDGMAYVDGASDKFEQEAMDRRPELFERGVIKSPDEETLSYSELADAADELDRGALGFWIRYYLAPGM